MNLFVSIFFFTFPIIGNAEVMDKEFSLSTVLQWGVIGTTLVFVAARFKPWLLIVLFPVIGSFFYLQLSELVDPYVGPAITSEAGNLYVFISWGAAALVLIGGGVGYAVRRRNSSVSVSR